jgi:hypothetical protein
MAVRMRIIPIVLVALAAGSPAIGQDAAMAPQEVAPKDAKFVYVLHARSPEEIRGRLLQFGPDSLTILMNGQQRTLPLDDVLRVQVAGDSVKNGALLGAIVLGALCVINCGLELDGGELQLAIAVNAGFGALIGAGIDADHQGRTTIYTKGAGSAAGTTGRQAGVSFRLRF